LAEYLQNTAVFHSDRFSIDEVCCRAESPDRSASECNHRPSIAFVRSGVFRKHLGRTDVLADANHVVFFNAGEEYRVSHPVAGGDDCLSLTFDAEALFEFAIEAGGKGDQLERPFALTHCLCSSATALRLYCLVSRIRRGVADSLEVQEQGLSLLATIADESRAFRAAVPGRRSAATEALHRKLADSARELIARDPGAPLTLPEIGDAVGASPYHLVRLFARCTGLPLHRYRNRLRLRLAIKQLTDGERDLTSLAMRLGFASHSHFTDAFRREFHLSPSSFRRGMRV
jgi:AraC-like DNA-binding protein